MGITKEEWDRLKDNEKYGMIANILTRVETLEKTIKGLKGLIEDGINK